MLIHCKQEPVFKQLNLAPILASQV